MNEHDQQWQAWIRQLADGDSAVAAEFWTRYGERLNRLADKHMAPRIQKRVGPEDVVQSVCRTFFRRAQAGEFKFDDSDSLWRLLCAITLTKVRMHVRFHQRQKRGVDKERSIEATTSDSDDGGPWQFATNEPTADELAEFADQLEKLLDGLGSEEQQLIELKLQGFNNHEVAERMTCSERTVRRILKRVQASLQRMLSEGRDDD